MATNPNFSVNKDATLEDVNAVNLNVAGAVVGSGLNISNSGFNVAVGYGSSTFGTLGIAGVQSLNRAPGLAADAAVTIVTANANTLILPPGAIITRAYVGNNGTVINGGTDYDIGVSATAATSDALFDAVTTATVNAGGGAGGIFAAGAATTSPQFASVGVLLTNTAGFVTVPAAGAFVTVTANTSANTAGDLKVVLEYLVM